MPDRNVNQLPNDPDVKIPAAVKAAAQRAEQIHAEAYNTNVPTNPGNGGASGDAGQSRDPNTPQTPEVQRHDTVSLAPPGTPPAERPDSGTVQRERQPPDQGGAGQGGGAEQPVDWEQRYKSLKGRHDQLGNENRAMAGRMANMEQTLATLSAPPSQPSNPDFRFGAPRPAAPPQTKHPPVDPNAFQLTDQERADYGDEFLGVVGKRAMQEVFPVLESIRAENEQLKRQLSQVGSRVAQTSQMTLEQQLDSHLPDWRQVNHDPNFLNWLALTDPYSGVRKQDLLTAAYNSGDAGRVLAFFNGFLSDEAAVDPARAPKPVNGGGGPPKVPLETFAAPGRARTTAGPTPPAEKPVISRDQISAFYAKVAAGHYRGNDAEKNRLEGMIFEAQREGRIQ